VARSGLKFVRVFNMLNQNGAPKLNKAAEERIPARVLFQWGCPGRKSHFG